MRHLRLVHAGVFSDCVRAIPALLALVALAMAADAPDALRLAKAPPHSIWLDSLDLTKVVQGFGQARAGKSVEQKPMTLGGVAYAHGLGTHSNGGMSIDLNGAAIRFASMVGIDDETGKWGSVTFEVWVDGKKVADSGVMRGDSSPKAKPLTADLRGAKRLTLIVNDAKDGGDNDHADWAGAHIMLLPGAMKRPLAVAFADPMPPLPPPPQRPGQHPGQFAKPIDGETFTGKYLLFLPEGYTPTNRNGWPMLVFLHGAGERGPDLNTAKVHGPPMLVEQDANFRRMCGMIILTPQCPPDGDWQTPLVQKYAIALIEDVCTNYRVDRTRIYATGLSMGGLGTWSIGEARPDIFAAIAPICSRATADPQKTAVRLKGVACQTYVGDQDGDFTTGTATMVQVLRNAGITVQDTIIKGAGHDVWGDIYNKPEFYERLLKFKKTAAKGK